MDVPTVNNKRGLTKFLDDKRKEYPDISRFIETATTGRKELVYSALLSLANTGSCPITPPIIGALTEVGYWKRIIGDKWTSKNFLDAYIDMWNMFE